MPRRHRPHTVPAGYLTATQVGAIMQVSGKTITRWARAGKLPFSRTLGGHRRFPEQEIRDLVTLNTVPADPPPGTPGY